MRTKRANIFYGVDLTLVLLYLFLVAFGWMNIYAASVTEHAHEILDFGTKYGKQLLWIFLSFVLIVYVDWKGGQSLATQQVVPSSKRYSLEPGT